MNKYKPVVGYVYDPAMTLHESHDDNPECPERIQEIYKCLLNKNLLSKMTAVKSREVTFDELKMVHGEEYLSTLEWKLRAPKGVRKQVEEKYNSIYVNEHTLMCAKLAAGSTIEIANQVGFGKLNSGIAIVRPPGHHAGPHRAMGFCIYNNIALAAKDLERKGKKVLIVDWDIHHGNGTQDVIEDSTSNNILFFSVHRYDNGLFYPRSGHLSESKNIINIGLNGDIGDKEYLEVFTKYLTPRATKFEPDIILVSAGFDAIENDPLGLSNVTIKCYGQMTEMLQNICNKIVLVLEGGYHLTNMANAFAQCTSVLLGIDE